MNRERELIETALSLFRCKTKSCYDFLSVSAVNSALTMAARRSIATVMGPMQPGTGVAAEHF